MKLVFIFGFIISTLTFTACTMKTNVYPKLNKNIEVLNKNFSSIDPDRIATLDLFAQSVKKALADKNSADVVFICTHNSRRSQIAQAWLLAAANYYGVNGLNSYSGGVGVTAFYTGAREALKQVGFEVTTTDTATNPKVELKSADSDEPLVMFSKNFADAPNPKSGFIAVMVCSHADEACPFVAGAAKRISLPYLDPKRFDGQAIAPDEYLKTVNEIGTEILYVVSKLSK